MIALHILRSSFSNAIRFHILHEASSLTVYSHALILLFHLGQPFFDFMNQTFIFSFLASIIIVYRRYKVMCNMS